MTEPPPGFVCLLRRGPRTPSDPGWEARRCANEAAYWAEHLEEFVKRLPGIRRHRGDERAARLTRDVVAAVGKAQGLPRHAGSRGPDEAVLARERLAERWRGGEGP